MNSLESIVLPLEQSRALVEAGIVLDTAMVWVGSNWHEELWNVLGRQSFEMMRSQPNLDRVENGATFEDRGLVIVSAPTLGELLDAIRAKVGNPLEERTIILSQDGHKEVSCCAGVRSPQGKYQIAYNDTDLLAAAALLREVSK